MKRWILLLLIVVIIAIPLDIRYSKGEMEAAKTPEEKLMSIIATKEANKENTKEVLKLIQDINIKNLDYMVGEGSLASLLDWLDDENIEDEEDIINLINIIDQFVGREYLEYLEILADVYVRDKVNFIKVLAKIPDRVEDVANGLYNIRIYDKSHLNIFNDINMIMESEELTEEEKEIGIHFLNTYASCIT